MKILVINSGSSSLKFQVIDSETEKVMARGLCERIGIDGSFTYKTDSGVSLKEPVPMNNHKDAVEKLLTALVDPEQGVLSSYDEIDVVGHRLVHGGEKFTGSVVITDEVIQAMTECNDLAPLHNPANLVGVDACKALMPETLMVGVFDTAFNQTMVCLIGFMKNTKSAVMVFTASATSMFLPGRQNLWGRIFGE